MRERAAAVAMMVLLPVSVGGCSPSSDEVQASTTTDPSSEGDTEDEDGGRGEDESESEGETEAGPSEPDLPPYEPCECEPGTLCVADCGPTADFDVGLWNFRCIGPPECSGEPGDLECELVACGYSIASISSCEGETLGADIVCIEDFEQLLCSELQQDCPEDEKCVLQVKGWEQAHVGWCVPVDENGAAVGEACSSQGVLQDTHEARLEGNDDCGADSMCWNGAISFEPFAGTCHAYCAEVDEVLTCPAGSSCQTFGPSDFYLCVPDP